ncbi:MAG: ABC transporter substrate-binding protein [Dehalococcoidales bacterium]|nr:MAG: ABC transporter substrate-binding protein [Dehalococcoidales bacterium]
MMKLVSVILTLVFVVCVIAGCGSQEEEELASVTIMLDWVPNTNHTGIFVAEAKGYFKDEGLDVRIIQPGEVYPEAAVVSGSADFGISFQEQVTLARADNIPIVSIAAVLQHNTSGFASLAELNITDPADFEGLRYGSFGSPFEVPTLKVLMACAGGDFEKLEIVNTGYADPLALMSEKKTDLGWIFYGWQAFQAEQQDIEINVVMMKDWFDCIPDYYTPIVIASEITISSRPEIVKAVVGALSRGYEFAVENPDDAADLLIAAVPELDSELVRMSQNWLSSYYRAEARRWGEQKESVWQGYADWMVENGILQTSISGKDAFTNEFLP